MSGYASFRIEESSARRRAQLCCSAAFAGGAPLTARADPQLEPRRRQTSLSAGINANLLAAG